MRWPYNPLLGHSGSLPTKLDASASASLPEVKRSTSIFDRRVFLLLSKD
jgi:hypothetical protein